MEYTNIIARKVAGLPLEKRVEGASKPKTTVENEAFIRRFNVDTSGYKLGREEANAH